MLIINADDYGRSPEVTAKTLRAFREGPVTSASAMVFMKDSRRSAELAGSAALDLGLHLNLDLPFDDPETPPGVRERQLRIARYFRRGRWTPLVYDPLIRKDLAFVVRAQRDEYGRLYGEEPFRFDGHHHLHLSANVLFDRLLPMGAAVRRSFTFGRGEKNFVNRAYRRWIDRRLARRHICADGFFSLAPIDDVARLRRIIAAAKVAVIEMMVHADAPGVADFLTGTLIRDLLGDCPRGTYRRAAAERLAGLARQ
jgi:predicted glycoside hydrolase/deacetylase ChbG (UPF0249 family)